VTEALQHNLSWSLKTSPPTGSEGMQRMIAKVRGVQSHQILPGSGSSTLIFLAFREWLNSSSRVLILDPMYGEYAHVLEQVVGCRTDRFYLARENGYRLDLTHLDECLRMGYDWVILVNPNSPTGQHVPGQALWQIIQHAPKTTRFWIDETYIDYVDPSQSLERLAVGSTNVVICKSMSKAFALSGARCAYLCGHEALLDQVRRISPPWAVSLPAQIAACEALRNLSYYQARWAETTQLRTELSISLTSLELEIISGSANFLLCHLADGQPTATALIDGCRKHQLFLRDVSNMGHCFDNRTFRIAVKDKKTNQLMLSILQMVLAEHAES
jgi:histidinol-phosphate/aromatic aminotransferase/cobyric acid decarboxylase-like protein